MDEADVDWIFLGGVMAFARVTWFEEGIDWSDDELLSFHFFSNHFVQKVFCFLSQLPSFKLNGEVSLLDN